LRMREVADRVTRMTSVMFAQTKRALTGIEGQTDGQHGRRNGPILTAPVDSAKQIIFPLLFI